MEISDFEEAQVKIQLSNSHAKEIDCVSALCILKSVSYLNIFWVVLKRDRMQLLFCRTSFMHIIKELGLSY